MSFSRSLLGLLALALTACDPPASPSPDDAPSDGALSEGTPLGSPTDLRPPAAPSTDRLPATLLGTYDEDAAACAQGMTMARLAVRPDTLRFYYGYAVVDGVAPHDGGYRVEATLYQTEGAVEVVPEPASYRIERTADGLRVESAYAGSTGLVRCDGARTGAASWTGAGAAGVESVYTEVAGCTTVEEDEESGGAVQRCPGVRGVPLYVSLGDLRYDVDAGVRNGSWETPPGFNSLGRTVEWRLRDGRPFAVIVRYDVDSGSGAAAVERRSDLAVIKVGTEARPGCLVGYVPAGAAPDQNTAARRLADREAATFDCGV